jgi:hypothetical protein
VERLKAAPDVSLCWKPIHQTLDPSQALMGISGDGNHIIGENHADDVLKSTVHLIVAVDPPVVGAGTFLA